MAKPDVRPGSLQVWSDVGCPWASLAVHRLRRRRRELGLDDAVRLDHRCFPLELVNGRPTPKRVLDAEVAVIAGHDPSLGWRPWQRPDWAWPGSTLLALEAVQAAKADPVGGLPASEQLDAALRHAFYAESRPVHVLAEVLDVARGCDALDADALERALRSGAARAAVFADWEAAQPWGVQGSPHVFLPDGGDVANPGLSVEWTGEHGQGYPVIAADDPSVYDDLLRQAAA